MGFLDNIRSKFNRGGEEYADGQYDEYYEGESDGYAYGDETYQPAQGYSTYGTQGGYGDGNAYAADSSNGLLGQTRRGEAESVAVYTRSGQPVGEQDRHASTYADARPGASRPGAYDTPSSYAQGLREVPAPDAGSAYSQTAARMSATLSNNPQLPAYILRPESYDDVETVVRRVRTRQPVALVFQGVRTEVAKRVLDFSYGFAVGYGASVQELGDRVFMVLPPSCEVQEADLSKLRAEGYLKK